MRTLSRTLLFIRLLRGLTVARCSIGSYLPGAGVARNMTMIPRKLKQAGYSTHMMCVSMLQTSLPMSIIFNSQG